MTIEHFYISPGLSRGARSSKLEKLQTFCPSVKSLKDEICYNVETIKALTTDQLVKLKFILSSPFSTGELSTEPHLQDDRKNGKFLIEIGPRLNFSTPFSTNAVAICSAIELKTVKRLEISMRYLIEVEKDGLDESVWKQLIGQLHDRMTECVYERPITSFDHGIERSNWEIVDVVSKGRTALEEVNQTLGLALDDWDLDYYTKLFVGELKRNPTTVECFDLAQSNSEHSRHWFLKGKMILNGEEQAESLLDMIASTQKCTNSNNVIKFSDNSSAINGFPVDILQPGDVVKPGAFVKRKKNLDLVFTAETHNFPTAVAPFSGATTGTGGRIRDVQAVGRGGLCIAGTAGYSVGNLFIPGYDLPWEDKSFRYPDNFAPPLQIIIEASNGASDYGNKFGEPLIAGFTRSFGQFVGSRRREWVKPIMFSAGIGCMDHSMIKKEIETGMTIVKIGGPVYRIGVGGGAASSIQVQGDNVAELDFGAVQRGDPQMENKMNRVVRACIENIGRNPICSIHDQGAGGNGNVLKELSEPLGAVIFTDKFTVGDSSISVLELWGAEYQESNAALIHKDDECFLEMVANRERCSVDFVGSITGSGKEFHLDDVPVCLDKLIIPVDMKASEAIERVLRLLSVGSKRFLTNKVDRCVTGLVAQQQCVGPLHTPLSDYAITALTTFDSVGTATSIGEQPIKGLISPEAGARMSVAEAVTNLMFAKISSLQDVKCSGNEMWAAKLPGEGATLFRAVKSMCNAMKELGIALDGGKDSLSMAARVGGDTVVAPGTVVVSTYAPCPDVTCKATPDLKAPAHGKKGYLLWVRLSDQVRLGGSALAQCFAQVGDSVPDLDFPLKLRDGFSVTQKLLADGVILAGHDVSDGGLITCLLEMAFGGLSGLDVELPKSSDPMATLFAEEVGWVLELASPADIEVAIELYGRASLKCEQIGLSSGFGVNSTIRVKMGGITLIENQVGHYFQSWEETSYKLEMLQTEKNCATSEFNSLLSRKGPKYQLILNEAKRLPKRVPHRPPRVAVLREEGTNGDREMASSLFMAGFEVWDVTTQDLIDNAITMDQFQGVIFPGGFSFADVLGSAKGWAACLQFNGQIKKQFDAFARRKDTFSLGVCNGCQLMALIGWIGTPSAESSLPGYQPNGVLLEKNDSERFECRFSTVRFEDSPAIMCAGMEGSLIPVWIAHGEGKFTYRNELVEKYLLSRKCVAFRYVDDDGEPTESYPMNPNGSKGGVAGMCSEDGRHLALMPHPERCSIMWQWPYVTPELAHQLKSRESPWLTFFRNAYVWACDNQSEGSSS
ncbi:unnamed protein product [Nesidiocoris tenuis]|uniref:Phosphoribosylformylglycinamidine synthase n=1 Tax=Nesidiocoris tenuis TaxID=355587 RepID=A0A6H5FZ37_9HEMI|nr:unnamed protein product [Nesidiocoris tenuis]